MQCIVRIIYTCTPRFDTSNPPPFHTPETVESTYLCRPAATLQFMAFNFPRFLTPRLPQNKKFEFQSRYYDADKERLQQRTESIARELELEKQEAEGQPNPQYRSKMQAGWAGQHRRHETRKSNRILLITIGVLVLAVYLTFFYGQ